MTKSDLDVCSYHACLIFSFIITLKAPRTRFIIGSIVVCFRGVRVVKVLLGKLPSTRCVLFNPVVQTRNAKSRLGVFLGSGVSPAAQLLGRDTCLGKIQLNCRFERSGTLGTLLP